MKEINDILTDTAHRPYALPTGEWAYYQEWNNALFFHWEIPFEVVRECVPSQLNLDSFEGKYYVSLVAFTMQKIRPRYLPSFKLISDFDEINLRTYVENDGKKGVYFLNIVGEKRLSNFIAKTLSGLPFEKSNIKRTAIRYSSVNTSRGYRLDTEFEIKQTLQNKTPLDSWLTERYCLFVAKGSTFYRYDVHHKEWEIKQVTVSSLKLNYKVGSINLADEQPILKHYSEGVKVIAWKREKVYPEFLISRSF